MIKQSYLKLGAALGTAATLIPSFAFADIADTNSDALGKIGAGVGAAGGSQADLPTLIGKLIGAVLGILGIILVFYIIQAGIKYMTANGDSKKTDDAKKMITTAVIGMIILIAAYSIASFIITTISGVV